MIYAKLMQWIGGKYRLLPQFLAMIVGCREYFELFIGSGAIFLNKESSKVEVICDADYGIATLWKVIGDMKLRDNFYYKFMALKPSKHTFDEFKEKKDLNFPSMSEVDIAVIVYYLTVYSFDGNRKNMRYGDKPDNWDEMEQNVKRALVDNWDRITHRAMHATILNANALDVLEVVKGRENALIVLDPPYVPELLGENKNLYDVHFKEEEHVRMLQLVQDVKAKIIICGYRGESFLYDRFLNKNTGWHCYIADDRLTKACKTSEKKDLQRNLCGLILRCLQRQDMQWISQIGRCHRKKQIHCMSFGKEDCRYHHCWER